MTRMYSDSIFWIEVEKIKPNPYQPRKEFDQETLKALAESIRQYGVLQPLVVTRKEFSKPDGGIAVEYELIAGERRLRASKIAQIAQVPVVIRIGENNSLMKLELAIIENLQREDLNSVDRARAFQQFVTEFHYTHIEIAKKIGKSREYVSNTLRVLLLPEEILNALVDGKINEGHTRPLLMLKDRPEEQTTLFKEIVYKKINVREAEDLARRVAKDKIRKNGRQFDPEIVQIEKTLTEQLGTRVRIETREVGGKITIDYFSDEDLKNLLEFINSGINSGQDSDLNNSKVVLGENSIDDSKNNGLENIVSTMSTVEKFEKEPIENELKNEINEPAGEATGEIQIPTEEKLNTAINETAPEEPATAEEITVETEIPGIEKINTEINNTTIEEPVVVAEEIKTEDAEQEKLVEKPEDTIFETKTEQAENNLGNTNNGSIFKKDEDEHSYSTKDFSI
ncbi:ParB/RepB/Spo0J family partition protein [Patescibacteria group bacterium]|nr:ParB/RepB/Spo0J family partition protein [Patescibacteria group bacterium]MBU1519214.1 ParB/RepB/Spo0J family partition protein [Patescibacteria group bacterium]MBU1956252.1 ParB/RepB/Spo0J family partition protein [Patescibacteria group bacterium]MBU2009933.1 ParB/RepB/Spo0J family partition protein [Patescibacteria group bacterium]MBU2416420.1 ParB/RepB/Spo0J family partition protein [Patescibacteria group bacterium]